MPFALNALHIGDRTVEYLDIGDPAHPAVVLVHGGCCTADDWDVLIEPLSKNYRLFLPDGFVHPFDHWALWRTLDFVGIDNAALLGHSAGGPVSRGMYRLAPQRVRAMIDVDANAVGKPLVPRKRPNDLFSPKAAAMYARNRDRVAQLKPHHQGDYPSDATFDRRMTAYARQAMSLEEKKASRPAPIDQGHIDYGSPPQPIDDTGKYLQCPGLIIQTGRGKVKQAEISDAFLEENTYGNDVEYHLIEEAGHWPWLEDPQGFLTILEPFLARTAQR